MPFVDDTIVNERIELTKKNQMIGSSIIVSPLRDTGSARHEPYTESEKIIIGMFGRLDGKVNAAKVFGMSKRTVEAFREGRNRQHETEVNPELKAKVDTLTRNFRNRLAGLASQKLEKTLEALTDDKLSEVTKAVDLANISSTLAKTVTALVPDKEEAGTGVHYHFYRPRLREEDEYDIIEAEAV